MYILHQRTTRMRVVEKDYASHTSHTFWQHSSPSGVLQVRMILTPVMIGIWTSPSRKLYELLCTSRHVCLLFQQLQRWPGRKHSSRNPTVCWGTAPSSSEFQIPSRWLARDSFLQVSCQPPVSNPMTKTRMRRIG